MNKMNVIVLGAGPAGLVAAETVVQNGGSVILVSKGIPGAAYRSELHGCQYLHEPVWGTATGPVRVKYDTVGAAGYQEKVYGEGWTGTVSPDEYGPAQEHDAWDLRQTYNALWRFWGSRAVSVIKPLDETVVGTYLNNPTVDLVISTIPGPSLCRRIGAEDQPHSFSYQSIWAIGQRTGTNEESVVFNGVPDNTVLCNGSRHVGWYRKARVFGYATTEWPFSAKKPPFTGVVRVDKPLKTNCDCWQETGKLLRVGRYGRWQKGYLVHQVVKDVTERITNQQLRLI